MDKFFSAMLLFVLSLTILPAQSDMFRCSNITGNFQFDAQSYTKDSLIGAEDVPQKILNNTWFRLNYNYGGFTATVRYEGYMDPILGYDPRLKGSGIAYRSLNYKTDFIEVTAGNFYEQFGNGMIFRTYEERQLGFDNSIDGARVKVNPIDGVQLTLLNGKMRSFWNQGSGQIRGGDLDVSVNDLLGQYAPSDLVITLGGSMVSRYQTDNSAFLYLPENVLAWSGRYSINYDIFSLMGEYSYKHNDPNQMNKYTYNPGTALHLSGAVFLTGLGVNVAYHRLDNMDFRAEREAIGNNLNMNYLPPLTKQHIYSLMTIYPYGTQLNGEVGVQVDITTSLLKDLFNDKMTADLTLNYSRIHGLDTTHIDKYTYESDFFSWGERKYYEEFTAQLVKSWSRKLSTTFAYSNQTYDKDILENEGAAKNGKVYSNIVVAEALWRIASKKTLRFNVQHLWSSQDSAYTYSDHKDGNWVSFLAEYSIAPNWFFAVMDDYNYNNPYESYILHYPSLSMTYAYKTTQISFAYGKQRGGLICVGGVCRPVLASNGFRLNVTTSF